MSKFDALIIVDIANKVTRLSKKVCVIDKRNSSAQTRLPQDMGKKQSILSLLQKTPQDADQRKVMRIAFHGDITDLHEFFWQYKLSFKDRILKLLYKTTTHLKR